MPVSWQLAQLLVMPVWLMGVPGPNAVKLAGAWQFSQAVVEGMWFEGGSLGTMFAKLKPPA
jgi:hypothetical protein